MSEILIIEDESDLRLLLKTSLEQAGFSVRTAADGSEGLAEYSRNPCPVVLTDIIMPNKEGLETILELRQLNRDVQIIAISGGGKSGRGEDILRHAKMCGAAATLTKPLVLKDLVSLVQLLSAADSAFTIKQP